ncbi:hypothetical protein MIH18_10615 [Marinobacter sp. M3C]|jgi:hypothetical protein|uniref:hypothetical protein n=1 Tax=unclassified Marinobacter TaxID=83889 RepID=UPI00200FAFC5|nr:MULTISPECIES: hypothetical protein [unclassified Marinobacter]MCL1477164.1 hypothetical protein [Marinobacter sp.]MCL1484860.1 hypothetical protein [Marinobacter sp.]UQG56483.1 hypothetical protein MIH16_02030 [Marinobacter sp. M4C]UQG62324.1 hypothetical protein MIH18_10615 [Marinobacter sp. M3C]UQG65287.1 hypothetical protein MIH17_02030 [Marinobacter sp. M2C]
MQKHNDFKVRMFVNGQALAGGSINFALEDGSGSLSMCLRASAMSLPAVVDITASGGWLVYLKNRQSKL